MKISKGLPWLAMLAVLSFLPTLVAAQQEDKREEKPQQAARNEDTSHKPLTAYRLDFVLSELADGKKVNSRSYSVLAQTDSRMNKLRSGARYPVATQNEHNSTQFQYLDFGVNIDCRLEEQDGEVSLYATIDSSSASWPTPDTAHSAPGQPVISQMRSEVRSPLHPGKPTMVSSMEDPASKRVFQVEVTATRTN